MNRNTFVEFADLIGERQAEAFYLRRVEGMSGQEAADEMDTSASNVYNLERDAYSTIIRARNLVNMVEGTGVEIEDEIGVCTECDDGTAELRPHPDDVSAAGHQGDLEDARMICPDCHDSISSD